MAPVAINHNLHDDWVAMLSSPDFTLRSAISVVNEGRELVQIDFDLRWAPTEKNPIRVVKGGRAWFDPKLLWVMRKCVFKMQRGPNGLIYDHSMNFEYDNADGTFPLLTTMTEEMTKANGEPVEESISTYSLTLADVSEDAFTLSAFGLPEPVGVVWPKPTRWWLWITLGAFGSGGLAFLFQKIKRRYRTPASPTESAKKEG